MKKISTTNGRRCWTLLIDLLRWEIKPTVSRPRFGAYPQFCRTPPVVFKFLCFRLYVYRCATEPVHGREFCDPLVDHATGLRPAVRFSPSARN